MPNSPSSDPPDTDHSASVTSSSDLDLEAAYDRVRDGASRRPETAVRGHSDGAPAHLF